MGYGMSAGRVAVLTLVLAAGCAVAQQGQPARSPGQSPAEDRSDSPTTTAGDAAGTATGERGDVTRERIEERIDRHIEDVERMRRWLQERRERLAQGEAPERIAAEVEFAGRFLSAVARANAESGRPGWRPFADRREQGGRDVAGRDPATGGHEAAGDWEFGEGGATAFLREHMPRMAERMEGLRSRDPGMADRLMRRMEPRLREIASVQGRDPELFRLRIAEFQTAPDVVDSMRRYREVLSGRAPSEGPAMTAAEARSALRSALARQLEARLAVQRHELAALQAQVAELEGDLSDKLSDQERLLDEAITRIETEAGRVGPRDGGARDGGRDGKRPRPEPR